MISYDPTQRNGDLDEFITPPDLIKACLNTFWFDTEEPYTVLDPGCNLGQWGEVLKVLYPKIMLVGVEVMDVPKNPAYDVWIPNQDFMTWKPDVVFDIIIGNPPYSVTRNGKRHTIVNEWIKHSFELLSSEGWIYYVLREGFDNNVRAWKTILSKHPPVEEHMLLPRPNFFGPHDKRTDGSSGARWNYSWVSFNSKYSGYTRKIPLFWKGKP